MSRSDSPSPLWRTADELAAQLATIVASPANGGAVEMIVARPDSDQRVCLTRAEISPAGGLHGDRWRETCSRRLPDGAPDPEVQITLMNSRCVQALSGDRSRWALAGDNLFVDLDLGSRNLPVGTRLRIGSVVIEITALPHAGCAKFKQRFGAAALVFVNSPEGREGRFRGAHARVIQAGVVQVGDTIARLD